MHYACMFGYKVDNRRAYTQEVGALPPPDRKYFYEGGASSRRWELIQLLLFLGPMHDFDRDILINVGDPVPLKINLGLQRVNFDN